MGVFERIFGRKRREARRAVEAEVRATLEREGPSAAWRVLVSPLAQDRDPVGLFHLAAHVLRLGGELTLAELFDRAADAPHDPTRLFELGGELSSADEGEAGAAMLERALAFAPFDAVIRSELALAQARMGRPDRVVETLALHPCLGEDPGALFQFGWASLLCGDLEAAEGALAELHVAPPLRQKLRNAIERARLGVEGDPPDARDWLFVEHGALLLDASGARGGRHAQLEVDGAWAAAILGQARWLLPELLPPPRRVLAIDEAHAPLAEAVARACEGTVVAPGKGRIPSAIVPLWEGASMRALSREDLDADDALFFAVTMDYTRALPRVPNVVGAFARKASMGDAPLDELELGPPDPALRAFVEARRTYLPPRGPRVRAAYVPDEPLPR